MIIGPIRDGHSGRTRVAFLQTSDSDSDHHVDHSSFPSSSPVVPELPSPVVLSHVVWVLSRL